MPPAIQMDVEADQQALFTRIEQTTRWLKRVLDYQSSKNTEDFRAMAYEKLLRSEKYAPVLREEPRRLMGLVPQMMRRILADDARRDAAFRRPSRRQGVALDDLEIGAQGQAEGQMELQHRMTRLYAELDRFASGESSPRIRPANREPMTRAFRMKLEGMTDAGIAEAIGVSKPTINNWLQMMTAHLAVRLSEETP